MSSQLSAQQSSELDQKIAETWKHIQTERKILEGAQLMRQATSNQDVLRRNDAKIRETQRTLAYFEDTLSQLQARRAAQQHDDGRQGGPSTPQVSINLHVLVCIFESQRFSFERCLQRTGIRLAGLSPPRLMLAPRWVDPSNIPTWISSRPIHLSLPRGSQRCCTNSSSSTRSKGSTRWG